MTGQDDGTHSKPSNPLILGVSTETWARVGVITALFAAVFWSNLRRLWLKTNPFTGEANWSHSVLVPVVGLYYLFIHREDLIKAGSHEFIWGKFVRNSRLAAGISMLVAGAAVAFVTQTHSGILFSLINSFATAVAVLGGLALLLDWSLATTLFGLGMFVYGIYPGQNDYLKDLGMVVTLFGIVLMLAGWGVMRIAWFPIAFLVCALPWPGLVYSWVAEPLQHMAATVAVDVLKLTGVESNTSGTKIVIANANPALPPRELNVAEACAGMRSLMTFIAVAGAIAFLSPRPLWQKIIIVVSSVPIAIFCNVMRISGQGLLDHYVSPQWSESFAHQFVGMMMLLPAFFLILAVGWVLDQLFIEEADDALAPAVKPTVIAAPKPAVITIRPAAAAPITPAAPAAIKPPISPTPKRPPLPTTAASLQQASAPPRPASPKPAPPLPTPPRPVTATPPPPARSNIPPAAVRTRPATGVVPPRPPSKPKDPS